MTVPFVLNAFAPAALSAKNKAQSVIALAAVQLSMTLLLTWALVPYGTLAVAAADVARGWLTMPYQQLVLRRHADVATRGTMGAIALPLAASVAMAAAIFLAKPLLADLLGDPYLVVAAGIALGLAVYGSLLPAFGRPTLLPYTGIVADFVRRRKAVV